MAEPSSQAAIKKSLAAVLPGVALDNINPSPVNGVSEVQVGPRLLYVTNDGKYMLQGSLIDLETRVDVSEERRKGIRLGGGSPRRTPVAQFAVGDVPPRASTSPSSDGPFWGGASCPRGVLSSSSP